MNVIIYAGSETNPKSVDNTLALLSSLALPNYTVQLLPKVSFIREPWEIGCKLFVIPYLGSSSSASPSSSSRPLEIFGQKEVKRLRAIVEQDGGAVLGIGLGAQWEAASAGAREKAMFSLNLSLAGGGGRDHNLTEPLKFHDKALASFVIPQVNTTILQEAQPVAEGDNSQLDVTAAKIIPHGTPDEVSSLSIVRPIGKGHVAFIRPTLTTPLSEVSERLVSLLHSTVSQLGLKLPALRQFSGFEASSTASGPPRPLPQFLTSIPSTNPDQAARPIVSAIRQRLFPSCPEALGAIQDTTDTFAFLSSGSEQAASALQGSQGDSDNELAEKVVIVCPDGTIPPKDQTPKFDIALYYDSLRKLKGKEDLNNGWGIGEALLYGERVTSTQTMFDRNPQYLTSLPTPILSLASQQISGRGRGKNVWLSPDGCLMFSLLLRIELDHGVSKSAASPAPLKGADKTSKTTTTASKTTTSGGGLKTGEAAAKSTKTESGPGLKTTDSSKTSKTTHSELKSSDTPSSLKSSPAGLKTGESKTSKTSSMKTGQTSHGSPSPIVSQGVLPKLPASRLVFVQYLFALAVSEACRYPEVLGPELGKRVRLKWPNDIYLDLSDGGVGEVPQDWNLLKKIGGVLVNTNFGPGGKVELVIGCGTNILNEAPITSLAQLKQQFGGPDLSLERTAATIMTVFERLWDQFVADRGSFASFEGTYLANWLHQDQRVTLTTVDPPRPVRIVGITPDYGLLRTVPERSGLSGGNVGHVGLGTATHFSRYVYPGGEQMEYIDLQPDGNSFDLMAGLIKAKTT